MRRVQPVKRWVAAILVAHLLALAGLLWWSGAPALWGSQQQALERPAVHTDGGGGAAAASGSAGLISAEARLRQAEATLDLLRGETRALHAALETTHQALLTLQAQAQQAEARAAQPCSSAGAAQPAHPWPTIGIPTVPRRAANATYLTTTLTTLLHELPADPSGAGSRWRLHGQQQRIMPGLC